MTNEAVGAIFLSKSTGRMMLNLRSDTSTYSNNWGFVGGKIEYRESPIEALHREIKEELGDSVPNMEDIIPFDVFCTKNGKFKYYSFVVVVKDEFIPNLNHESAGYAWVKIGNWPKPLHPGAKSTLYNPTIVHDFTSLWDSIKNGKPFLNSLPM
jgi:8-oxo-dGTP pyrophosphatase MutT (NUDIX family)